MKRANNLRTAARQRRKALKSKTTIGVTSRKAMQSGAALKARTQQIAKSSKGLDTRDKFLQKSFAWNRNRILDKFEKYDINDFKEITTGVEIDLLYMRNVIIDPYRETGFDKLVNILLSMDLSELYVREMFIGDDADIQTAWENYHEFSLSESEVWIVGDDGYMVTKPEEEERLIGVWTKPLTGEEQKMIQDIKEQIGK